MSVSSFISWQNTKSPAAVHEVFNSIVLLYKEEMLAEVSLHQLIKLLVDWNIDWLNDSLIIERFLFTEKYPHDSEQSIQTLSYMIGDQDCALMVARRLPRCWPRILALATTLGPEVSRNTVAILSGVKNVSYTWEYKPKWYVT